MLLLLLLLRDPLLQEVAGSYRLNSHIASVRRVLSERSKMDPDEVFRAHWKDETDVVEQPDVGFRVHLDQLLGAISALHIGGFGSTATEDPSKSEMRELLSVLEHSAVKRYYLEFYPYAPPVLAVLSWLGKVPDSYSRRRRQEQSENDWEAHYRSFLHLDAKFTARSKMSDFLDLIDDYEVNGIWLEDLCEAFSSPRRLERFARRRTNLNMLEGLDAFLMFSRELDSYLASLDGLPILRGHVWLHFAYWYGNGGEHMRDVVGWVWDAVLEASREAKQTDRISEIASESRDCIQRLSDPLLYPEKLFRLVDGALAEWAGEAGLLTDQPEVRRLMSPRF